MARVRVFDVNEMLLDLQTLDEHFARAFGDAGVRQVWFSQMIQCVLVTIVTDAYAACEGAEVLTVLTEWDEFKWIDLDKVADVMVHRRVVDTRNLLDRSALTRRGFEYHGVGRI